MVQYSYLELLYMVLVRCRYVVLPVWETRFGDGAVLRPSRLPNGTPYIYAFGTASLYRIDTLNDITFCCFEFKPLCCVTFISNRSPGDSCWIVLMQWGCIWFWFDVDVLSCRYGRPVVEVSRSRDRLVSPMGSQLLLRWHCDIESVPCLRTYYIVLFRYPIYFVPHKGAVGMASLYWIGPLFKFLWVMVRCRDVFLPVWEARCGGEMV